MGLSDRTDDRGFNSYVENKNNTYSHIILELENLQILDFKMKCNSLYILPVYKTLKNVMKNKFEKNEREIILKDKQELSE